MGSGLGSFSEPQLVGRGGMGSVFRSTHVRLGLEVALKTVSTHVDGSRRRAFERELRAVARVEHAHVVDLLAAGEAAPGEWFEPGTPWMAMELARGSLAQAPPTTWDGAREVLRCVLSGLGAVHGARIVHRDLTPGNVLDCGVAGSPWWRLSDFGLAELDGARLRGGTVGFLSPEVRTGRREGPWSDLYAVGCLAWWLACGAPPSEVAWRPRVPVPAGLDGWIDRCLQAEPGDRWGSARAAWLALAPLRATGGAPNTPTPRVDRSTWAEPGDDAVVDATEPVFDGAGAPPPESWLDLEGARPTNPRTWGLRAQLATDPGLALLAAREPPLVGRLHERDALWAAVREVAATGRTRLLRLGGPRGVGHTRLLQWLTATVRASGSMPLAEGPDGRGTRLWVLDRGEAPADLEQQVSAAQPGLLCVAVAEPPDLVLEPLTDPDVQALVVAQGATFDDGPWFAWWSKGRPGAVLKRFDGLLRLAPERLRAVDHPLPPLLPDELAWAEARSPEERLHAAERFAADTDASELPERPGHLLAAYTSLPAEDRLALHRRVGGRSPIARALQGEGVQLVVERGGKWWWLLDVARRALPPDQAAELDRVREGHPANATEQLAAAFLGATRPGPVQGRLDAARWLHARGRGTGLLVEALRDLGRSAESADIARTCPVEADANTLASCARTLREVGEHDAAEQIAAREPTAELQDWLYVERGELARARGDLAAAEAWYTAAFRVRPRGDVLLNLALLQLEAGRHAEADATAARVSLFSRGFGEVAAALIRARVAARSGAIDDALRCFRRVDDHQTAEQSTDPDFDREARRLVDDLRAAGDAAAAALVDGRRAAWLTSGRG